MIQTTVKILLSFYLIILKNKQTSLRKIIPKNFQITPNVLEVI
jgi:hypothetical protein